MLQATPVIATKTFNNCHIIIDIRNSSTIFKSRSKMITFGATMGKQTFFIRLEEGLARRAADFLATGQHGYASMDEFLQVALQNQLGIEMESDRLETKADASRSDDTGFRELLARPEKDERVTLAEPPADSKEPLFVLTNRLSPVKIAVRVLARLGNEGAWPDIQEFQEKAAKLARHVGLRLRATDVASEKKGQARRWIAYPVGEDERSAYGRFVTSFTMQVNDEGAVGPMAVLGLGNVENGRAALTRAGWQFAAAPSPILDGAEGATLSPEEATILRSQILRAPGERDAVREFLQIAKRGAGSQARIDEMLAARHPDWTETFAVAHRSAMIGRLSDLAVLESTGRGPNAKLRLLPHAEEFLGSTESQEAT